MSLLIKGADISPDHIQCITVFPEGFAVVEEYEWGLPIKTTKCEVMSIPTPHGRLEDLDAAIMLLQKYYDRVKDDVPTIIEAEKSKQ